MQVIPICVTSVEPIHSGTTTLADRAAESREDAGRDIRAPRSAPCRHPSGTRDDRGVRRASSSIRTPTSVTVRMKSRRQKPAIACTGIPPACSIGDATRRLEGAVFCGGIRPSPAPGSRCCRPGRSPGVGLVGRHQISRPARAGRRRARRPDAGGGERTGSRAEGSGAATASAGLQAGRSVAGSSIRPTSTWRRSGHGSRFRLKE